MAFLLSACSMGNEKVVGDGHWITVTREVSPFDAIHTDGYYIVNIVAGQPQSVKVNADQNLVRFIKTEVINHALYIKVAPGISLSPSHTPTITVAAPHLDGLQTTGAIQLNAKDLHSATFSLNASGAGHYELQGRISDLIINTAGATRIDAKHLITQNAQLTTSGASRIDVNVKDQLTIKASGSSHILYYGNPKTVKEDISGSGWIKKGVDQ